MLGRTLPQGAGKVFTCPNSAFVSSIKVKFLEVIKPFCVILPEIQKPERKVSPRNRRPRRFHEMSGRSKFTVQLKMASTRQMETLFPIPFSWSVVVYTPELCRKVTWLCGNFHRNHGALFGASFVDFTPADKASGLLCPKSGSRR